jgi:hypothetical protein
MKQLIRLIAKSPFLTVMVLMLLLKLRPQLLRHKRIQQLITAAYESREVEPRAAFRFTAYIPPKIRRRFKKRR